jgi:hypothetical protein
MSRGDEDVAESAQCVELEATLDGRDPPHAPLPKALVPAALGANLLGVFEELDNGRVVAVEPALHDWNRALLTERRPNGKARE